MISTHTPHTKVKKIGNIGNIGNKLWSERQFLVERLLGSGIRLLSIR